MNKDQEYLSRPLIEGMTYIITADDLRISSPCTLFAEAKPYIPLKKDAILQLYAEVLHTAKRCGVKVGYRLHLKRCVMENWDEYEKGCHEAQHLYVEMLGKAGEAASRGLHYGTTDDTVLKALQAIEAKYHALFWRNRSIAKISDVKSHLESAIGYLAGPDTGHLTIYL